MILVIYPIAQQRESVTHFKAQLLALFINWLRGRIYISVSFQYKLHPSLPA